MLIKNKRKVMVSNVNYKLKKKCLLSELKYKSFWKVQHALMISSTCKKAWDNLEVFTKRLKQMSGPFTCRCLQKTNTRYMGLT